MPFDDKMMIPTLSNVSGWKSSLCGDLSKMDRPLDAESGNLHSSPNPTTNWLCDFGQFTMVPCV